MFSVRVPRESNDEDSLADELRQFGATDEQIEQTRIRAARQADRELIEVHADNWDTVRVFEALGTQWRFAGLQGMRVGLDYQAIEPTARLLGVEITERRFAELRLMEQVAMRELGKQMKRTNPGGRRR